MSTKNVNIVAVASKIKCSVYKLNLVLNLIRNMSINTALLQLQFCQKRVAKDVLVCLYSAIANAQHNYSLDVDNLYIKGLYCGKAFVLKRIKPRARGRTSVVHKCFCNLRIVLGELSYGTKS